jgi:hypothetical protein
MDVANSGFWKLAAVTMDAAQYPDDPRGCGSGGGTINDPSKPCLTFSTVWARSFFDQRTQRARDVLIMIGGDGNYLSVYAAQFSEMMCLFCNLPCSMFGLRPLFVLLS